MDNRVALAKLIAKYYPDGRWAKSGMRCKYKFPADPDTHCWRLLGEHWRIEDPDSTGRGHAENKRWWPTSLDNAIDQGPDLYDEVTVWGLMALLDVVELKQEDRVWQVTCRHIDRKGHFTVRGYVNLAETLAHAVIEQMVEDKEEP